MPNRTCLDCGQTWVQAPTVRKGTDDRLLHCPECYHKLLVTPHARRFPPKRESCNPMKIIVLSDKDTGEVQELFLASQEFEAGKAAFEHGLSAAIVTATLTDVRPLGKETES